MARKQSPKPAVRGSDPESALRIEVFGHLFASVCEEMGAALQRSAFSPNIKERRDFSCALFDGAGRTIGQAAHLPIHLGATPMSVREVLEDGPLADGEAVLLNDPYRGGTHLPDLTLVSPVFLSGKRAPKRARVPDFLLANRAHHADVGGAHPGSMGPAFDVHGEGLRIPPVRLVRAGKLQREMLRLLSANMRVPKEREADLMAQWAANRLGAARLASMAERYGVAQLKQRAEDLSLWTERLLRAQIKAIPNGEYTASADLELGADGARIEAKWIVRGSSVCVDLCGSSDQGPGPINTTRAVSQAAVVYVLRLLLPAGSPANDGIARSVELRTRAGSLVDATYPTCVAAGNVETSQRLVDVLLAALSKALPGRIPASSAGTMSNLTLGGTDSRGRQFAHYETLPGGAGGGPSGVGAHAVQTHMTNTRNTPIEALETQVPVRILALGLRNGSGGKGAARGGMGIRKRILLLKEVGSSWVAERQIQGPDGAAGGAAGKPGRARLRLAAVVSGGARSEPAGRKVGTLRPGPWRSLPGQWAGLIPEGAELELETPGGGGFGSPRT